MAIDLILEHNVDSNNKFMHNHVHGRFVDCKYFAALKVINSMGELKKWMWNFNAKTKRNCNNKQITIPPSQHTCRNYAAITSVLLSNPWLQLLCDLKHNFFGDAKIFNWTLIFILNHDEIGILGGVSSFNPIINLH